eukprot:9454368-Pyramimonas_sp.AAC.1
MYYRLHGALRSAPQGSVQSGWRVHRLPDMRAVGHVERNNITACLPDMRAAGKRQLLHAPVQFWRWRSPCYRVP